MGLWQASPRDDCPSLFSLYYFYSDAICNRLQGFRKDGSEQRRFSVCHHVLCCKFVSGISEENTHLQPFSSTFPKSVSLSLSKIYFFSWQRPLWSFFLPFYIFLISICLLSLIWRPMLICIFIGRCTVWRESLFPADFFKYNSGGSSKDRPHHALLWLLLCFPVCDRNGRWQWLMHVGSTARRHRRNNIFIKPMEPTKREKESCVSL